MIRITHLFAGSQVYSLLDKENDLYWFRLNTTMAERITDIYKWATTTPVTVHVDSGASFIQGVIRDSNGIADYHQYFAKGRQLFDINSLNARGFALIGSFGVIGIAAYLEAKLVFQDFDTARQIFRVEKFELGDDKLHRSDIYYIPSISS